MAASTAMMDSAGPRGGPSRSTTPSCERCWRVRGCAWHEASEWRATAELQPGLDVATRNPRRRWAVRTPSAHTRAAAGDRAGRRDVVGSHPRAYLRYRRDVIRELLALPTPHPRGAVYGWFGDDSAPAATNRTRRRRVELQDAMRGGTVARGTGWLFRPWRYVVLAAALIPLAWRDPLASALLASAVLVRATALVVAPTPDYRYSMWLVVATLIVALPLAARRWRRTATKRLDDVRAWLASRPPRVVLVAGWIVFVLGCYPGYLSYVSATQLGEVRSGVFSDAHPAVMTQLWSWAEYVAAGPFPMLALQSGLALFGLAAIARGTLSARAAVVVAVAIVLFPPVFAPLAVIWPESLLAGCLLAGTAALCIPGRRYQIAGAIALVVACACRLEAALAIIPIVALAVPAKARWRGSRSRSGSASRSPGSAGWPTGCLWIARATTSRRCSCPTWSARCGRAHVSELVGARRPRGRRSGACSRAPRDRSRCLRLADQLTHGDRPARRADHDRRELRRPALCVVAHGRQPSRRVPGASRAAVDPRARRERSGMEPVFDSFGDPEMIFPLHHRATPSDWQIGMRAIVRARRDTAVPAVAVSRARARRGVARARRTRAAGDPRERRALRAARRSCSRPTSSIATRIGS